MYHGKIFGSSSKVFGDLRKSSDLFGNFRKFTESVRERSSGLRNNFGKSSEIFGKWSKIFGKSSKTPSSVRLYNKQNNTWMLGDMEFIFSCAPSISHSKINSISPRDHVLFSIYLLSTEITKSHLNNRICQHCGVKTSTVTPSFYYVFYISLSCNINIPSFIGNLWWVLLLGNHLNRAYDRMRRYGSTLFASIHICIIGAFFCIRQNKCGTIVIKQLPYNPKRKNSKENGHFKEAFLLKQQRKHTSS